MFRETFIEFKRANRGWGNNIIYLMLLFFMLSPNIFAETGGLDLFSQSFGPYFMDKGSDTQTVIDRLTEQLTTEPYRAELYYYLARAYANQGWHEKSSQYLSQWIKLSNNGIVVKGQYAFVLDEGNDKVLAIDTNTRQVVRKIDVDWLPRKIVPTPDGYKLYVTNSLANSVSAISTEKMGVTKTIKAGNMPWNGESSPQGDRVYVTNLRSDDISVIDTKTNTLLENVKAGQGPWGIAISPDGHRLFVSNQNSQDIRVIDTGNYNIVDVISIGTHPRDIALAPDDSNKLYAVDMGISGDEVEIYVVDLEDSQVLNSMNVPVADDPLLTRLQQMSLEDKLKLICSFAQAGGKSRGDNVRPGIDNPPYLSIKPRSSNASSRPLTDKDPTSEWDGLPMGGPLLMEQGPATDEYVNVPAASNERPMPSPKTETRSSPASPQGVDSGEKKVMRIIVVVKHDTLWKISMDNYGMASNGIYKAIQSLNPAVNDVNTIYAGQKIKLPAIDDANPVTDASPATNAQTTYTRAPGERKVVVVKPNDNLFRIALKNYGTVNDNIYAAILQANPRIKDINKIIIGQKITLPDLSYESSEDNAKAFAQAGGLAVR